MLKEGRQFHVGPERLPGGVPGWVLHWVQSWVLGAAVSKGLDSRPGGTSWRGGHTCEGSGVGTDLVRAGTKQEAGALPVTTAPARSGPAKLAN